MQKGKEKIYSPPSSISRALHIFAEARIFNYKSHFASQFFLILISFVFEAFFICCSLTFSLTLSAPLSDRHVYFKQIKKAIRYPINSQFPFESFFFLRVMESWSEMKLRRFSTAAQKVKYS